MILLAISSGGLECNGKPPERPKPEILVEIITQLSFTLLEVKGSLNRYGMKWLQKEIRARFPLLSLKADF